MYSSEFSVNLLKTSFWTVIVLINLYQKQFWRTSFIISIIYIYICTIDASCFYKYDQTTSN